MDSIGTNKSWERATRLRPRHAVAAIVSLLAIMGTRPALATVYLVDGVGSGDESGLHTWSNAMETIEDALTAAGDGDEIWVKAGTYIPSSGSFHMEEGEKLYGGFEGSDTTEDPDLFTIDQITRDFEQNETILSGDDSLFNVVTFDSNVSRNTIVDGFTITGAIDHAILCDDHKDVMLVNLSMHDNKSSYNGAAVYVNDSSPLIESCSFTNNYAANGGALAIDGYESGGDHHWGFPEVYNSTFVGNKSSSAYAISGGGAVFLRSFQHTFGAEPAHFLNCEFWNNTTIYGNGGAIYKSGDAWLHRCRFYDNTAKGDETYGGGNGGAVYGDNSNFQIFNCDFEGNDSIIPQDPPHGGPNGGGALFCTKGEYPCLMSNCRFYNNKTDGEGGAACIDYVSMTASNITVVGNSAPKHAGMFVYNAIDVVHIAHIANSIFWANVATDSNSMTPVAAAQLFFKPDEYGQNPIQDEANHSCIEEYSSGGGNVSGTCNIEDDPRFMDQGHGDLHLLPTSTCIDVGDTTKVFGDIADFDNDGAQACGQLSGGEYMPDLDLNERVLDDPGADENGCSVPGVCNYEDAVVDMGCYEFIACGTNGPIYVDADSPASTPDGTSWATAFQDLQDGLAAAATELSGCDGMLLIRVAEGTYMPDGSYIGDAGLTAGSGSRSATFTMLDGLMLEGGYAGYGEPDPDERDPDVHRTILSGDIGTADDTSDNTQHILNATDVSDVVVDGFIVTLANTQGDTTTSGGAGLVILDSDIIVRQTAFVANSATGFGGAFGQSGGTADFERCRFLGNGAHGCSAALSLSGNLTLDNCAFSGNFTTGGDSTSQGTVIFGGDTLTMKYCTMARNSAYFNYAGVVAQNCDANITNCILWGNRATYVPSVQSEQLSTYNATLGLNYSCVEGLTGSYGGTGNIGDDPQFLDADGADDTIGTEDDNLRLAYGSPAIDVGTNLAFEMDALDLDGNSRYFGEVDMGAYEAEYLAIYVDADSPAGTPDGASWATAYLDLQNGLAAAETAMSGTTTSAVVLVAEGTYLPDGGYIGDAGTTTGTGARSATFDLPDNVTLLGGYAGYGQTDPDERDPAAHPTILSGDIGTTDDASDNSYHILTADDRDGLIVVDGFTITKANTSGATIDDGGAILIFDANLAVTDCLFVENHAEDTSGVGLGAATYMNVGSVDFHRCRFLGNTATGGAAVWTQAGNATFENCLLAGNTSAETGFWSIGALMHVSGSLKINDCTIANNDAYNTSGGVFAATTDVSVSNTILFGNTATTSSTVENQQIYDAVGAFSLENSCVEGLTGSLGGSGNIGDDPRFVDPDGADNTLGTADDNYRLGLWSPAIDAGDDADVPIGVTTDLDGNTRFVGTVDMGAYEMYYVAIYVDADSTAGTPDGLTWSTAYQNLQNGLTAASTATSGGEIPVRLFVAAGTYYPDGGYEGDTGSDTGTGTRTARFNLVGNVSLEGGYKGVDGVGSGTANDRDLVTYETILSGDIGTQNVLTDNSYTVVRASAVDESARVDGVTITEGYAEAVTGLTYGYGGGILNQGGATPEFRDCRIVDNVAYHPTSYSYGAGVYTDSGLPRFVNCDISDNEADGGAGVFIAAGGFSAINCLFSGNYATGDNAFATGGAISGGGTSTELVNCTIADNTSDFALGGGVSLPLSYLYGTHTMANCIFWGNTADGVTADADAQFYDGGGSVVTYSCIEDDDDSDGSIPFNTGGVTSNIDDDPQFVNAGSGDYRLDDSVPSPCIDAGDNSAVPSDGVTDLDGNPRIVNDDVDMGAYEDQ